MKKLLLIIMMLIVTMSSGTWAQDGNTTNGSGLHESFDGDVLPEGWQRYKGLLNQVMSGTESLTESASGWSIGTRNNVFDNHLYTNIYGIICNKWITTPNFEVPMDGELTFDLALTGYSEPQTAPNLSGVDDRFVVLLSTDDKQSWTILHEWNNAGSSSVFNEIPPSGTKVIIPMNAYAGKTVCIAFYVESTESNADNNLHIDNVIVGKTSGIHHIYHGTIHQKRYFTLDGRHVEQPAKPGIYVTNGRKVVVK